jgi:hypothetical protein
MGKILIAINTAGFFLNVLVFLMVVNLSGGEQAAPEKPSQPPAPGLDAIAQRVDAILDKKLSKLTTMDTKLQSLARDVTSLNKKVQNLALAQQNSVSELHESAVEAVAPAPAPAAAPAVAPAAAPAAGTTNGTQPPPAETRPEEKQPSGEKPPETPPGGQP